MVNYPGLSQSRPTPRPSPNSRQGVRRLLTFGLESEKACFDFIRRVKLAYHLANLGDCKTLVIHPWSSQYINFTEDSRRANGIAPDMVRVSVGIEALEDIKDDFARRWRPAKTAHEWTGIGGTRLRAAADQERPLLMGH